MSALSRRVEPFRALRYDQRFAAELSSLLAPPYDLIGAERQAELYDRSPYNVVRLELNRDADRYQSAARTLDRWINERVLVRDAKPAIYLYKQKFHHEARTFTREAFVLRFRLEEFSPGRILPHERTFPAAREDRLKLLAATETNVSSIFGLYSGEHRELGALREQVARREAISAAVDDLSIENELRATDSQEEIAIIQRALADSRVLIADGHHRYETALEYRRQRRMAENNPPASRPCDYTMMALVACSDPGLVVLPTHRVVRHLAREAIESFEEQAAELFTIERMREADQLRARLAQAGSGAIGVSLARRDSLYVIRLKDRAAIAARMPRLADEVRQLDVSILHGLVFEPIFRLSADAIRAGGNMEYTTDASAALEAVASGRADGAFLLNPPSVRDVERVSDAGATMPEKSTYFFPKLVTGLVMNPLRD